MKTARAEKYKTEVLLQETTMPYGVPVGVVAYAVIGLILSVFSLAYFIKSGFAVRPVILICVAALLFFLSYHLHRRYTSYFKIILNDDGEIIVRLLSRIKKINIDPAGKVEFWYQDSFEDEERGRKRTIESATISLYVVFYDVNGEPVMGMKENQIDLWHNPRPGFQKIEEKNNKMIPDFLNTIDMYPGPVLKIYNCCG